MKNNYKPSYKQQENPSPDIEMKFGIGQCTMLPIKNGKREKKPGKNRTIK